MTRRLAANFVAAFLLAFSVVPSSAAEAIHEDDNRTELWVDLYAAEPVDYEEMLADLADVDVVFLGERHGVRRHHRWQARIIGDLAERGKLAALAVEHLETPQQEIVDDYAAGAISFEEFAKKTEWPQRWRNYRQYRPSLEAAIKARRPILAANAPGPVIKAVFRKGGVDRLSDEQRRQLPERMRLQDDTYQTLLEILLGVHVAANDKNLRAMVEAQIARDEHMAEKIVAARKRLNDAEGPVVVLCGAGHVAYGLGTADRVAERLPSSRQRIVIFSESGEVELTDEEKAHAREIAISHDDLRRVGRPIGDFALITQSPQR